MRLAANVNVFVTLESKNPGGSIKDRLACKFVETASESTLTAIQSPFWRSRAPSKWLPAGSSKEVIGSLYCEGDWRQLRTQSVKRKAVNRPLISTTMVKKQNIDQMAIC